MNDTITQTTLKDFDVLKQVGKGAYGLVYKVRRKSDKSIYALKTIDISKMDKKSLTNTLNEIRILCSINHPNIVGYKEAFIENDGHDLCVVMEFVGGGDLSEKIANRRKNNSLLNENTIWKYMIQILNGLRALHDIKIIHRDIKSANIFLTDNHETVKLGDLNVAKVAKDDLAQTQIGTPYYLAPEIWQNEVYDYRCDVFSLGCVLFEMAALEVPFKANSIHELFGKITKGEVPSIPQKYSSLLFNCIKAFLKKKPEERPYVHQILQTPKIMQKAKQLKIVDKTRKVPNANLMNTIQIPDNLNHLNNNLPQKYDDQKEEKKKVERNFKRKSGSVLKKQRNSVTKKQRDSLVNKQRGSVKKREGSRKRTSSKKIVRIHSREPLKVIGKDGGNNSGKKYKMIPRKMPNSSKQVKVNCSYDQNVVKKDRRRMSPMVMPYKDYLNNSKKRKISVEKWSDPSYKKRMISSEKR